jgi:hypothetical protein
VKTLATLALALTCLTAHADDIDGTDSPRVYRTGFYVGFANRETTATEIAWQLLNVVDTAQSVQIAKNPTCYNETGQLSLLAGSHPSVRGVYLGMGAFAVLHYVIAKGINQLVIENPDYMVVQRVYQYGNLAFKGYTIENNARIGLDLTHSRGCN